MLALGWYREGVIWGEELEELLPGFKSICVKATAKGNRAPGSQSASSTRN